MYNFDPKHLEAFGDFMEFPKQYHKMVVNGAMALPPFDDITLALERSTEQTTTVYGCNSTLLIVTEQYGFTMVIAYDLVSKKDITADLITMTKQ